MDIEYRAVRVVQLRTGKGIVSQELELIPQLTLFPSRSAKKLNCFGLTFGNSVSSPI